MSDSRINRRQQNQKKPKKKSWLKRILWTLLIIVIIIIGIAVYVAFQLYNTAQEAHQSLDRGGKSNLRTEKVELGQDPISMLLMGIESYATNGANGRADTQIVVTLNPETKQMTMVSVPRDTRVKLSSEIAGQYAGYHKINAAFHFASLVGDHAYRSQIRTVEKLLDIPIDKFVAVDFQGFVDIVSALGGVRINIKKGFWQEDYFNKGHKITFDPGWTTLNGHEALAFVRMRKRDVNTVYSRNERQRQFIKAAIRQAISVQTIFKLDDIRNVLSEHVNTNLKPLGILEIERIYSSMDPDSIKTLHIKGEHRIIDGKSFFIANDNSLQQVTQKLKKSLGLLESSSDGSSSTTEKQEGTSSTIPADEQIKEKPSA